MTPEMNLTYEGFIRGAFSINQNHMIDRWGDPASLADTDKFNFGDIEKVKAGAAYAMEIYRVHIINNCDGISDAESNDMDRIVRDVINAQDKESIYKLIKEFKQKYSDKYVKYQWNS